MEIYDPWDKDRSIDIEEFTKQRHARNDLLEKRTLAMLEQCKGLSVGEIKTITNRVVVRASAKTFLSE